MRELHTEILIHADAATVWSLLLDFDAYPRWNPFITQIIGTPEMGARLECRPRLPGARKPIVFHPRISCLEPEKTFAWKGHVLLPGLADGEHFFEIEPRQEGGVRLVHRQEYRGVLMPLLWPFFHPKTRQGFELMNEALKERAESGEPAGS